MAWVYITLGWLVGFNLFSWFRVSLYPPNLQVLLRPILNGFRLGCNWHSFFNVFAWLTLFPSSSTINLKSQCWFHWSGEKRQQIVNSSTCVNTKVKKSPNLYEFKIGWNLWSCSMFMLHPHKIATLECVLFRRKKFSFNSIFFFKWTKSTKW